MRKPGSAGRNQLREPRSYIHASGFPEEVMAVQEILASSRVSCTALKEASVQTTKEVASSQTSRDW
jgi:hypothetical protein